MAVKFQYNKTSLNNISKQLKIRQNALPTLKNKESALRLSAIVARVYAEELNVRMEVAMKKYDDMARLWNEFQPGLISVKDIELITQRVAGIKTPELKQVFFEIKDFDAFKCPAWYADGISILKEISSLGIESEVYKEKCRILDYNRRKTTQKVNLYEKVQIPGYQEAILKIKRYMEDEENLSKAASKIVKNRHEIQEEEEDTL